MGRLIWAFAGCTYHIVGNLMSRLMCVGSYQTEFLCRLFTYAIIAQFSNIFCLNHISLASLLWTGGGGVYPRHPSMCLIIWKHDINCFGVGFWMGSKISVVGNGVYPGVYPLSVTQWVCMSNNIYGLEMGIDISSFMNWREWAIPHDIPCLFPYPNPSSCWEIFDGKKIYRQTDKQT